MDQFRQFQEGKEIDVRRSVERQRSPDEGRFYGMMQSAEQYAFVYKVLRELVH
jgi:hypothetical protein